jgi:pimeloyl-ACP methyl ester carboxylesterase
VFLKPEVVHASFAQDLTEADRWTIVASQRPASLVANVTPSGAPAWRTLPSWAVIGTDDRVIPVEVLRRMAERAGSTVSELSASHVSMVSHADASVEAIVAAANSI